MSNAEQINWDRRYERVYPHIAGTLVRLCNTYGWGTVLGSPTTCQRIFRCANARSVTSAR